MKFRGEFKIENLHHFVGCLLSLRRLAAEGTESMNSVIRITRKRVSVVTKTSLLNDAYLEIYTDELFHSPYTLEGRNGDTIALNLSVSSLCETLHAAVNSEHAALKLKRVNQHASLSVSFPDPAFPSISITLDISITPLEEYENNKESLIPQIPPCSVRPNEEGIYDVQCNIGLTKFQSIICYLESANRIGNDLTEFEIIRARSEEGDADLQKERESWTKDNEMSIIPPQVLEASKKRLNLEKANIRKESDHVEVGDDNQKAGEVHGNHEIVPDNSTVDNETMHEAVLLKLRSPGILADLETIFYGIHSFSSHVDTVPDADAPRNPKTLLNTDAVYTICKNAVDSIIFNKHEALLVAAIPDNYLKTQWTYFIFSVIALESCQMVFMIPNQVPES